MYICFTGLDAEVTTDAAWLAVLRVGLAQQNATGLDGILADPAHADDWSRGHVGDQSWEERSRRQVSVVLLEKLNGWLFVDIVVVITDLIGRMYANRTQRLRFSSLPGPS